MRVGICGAGFVAQAHAHSYAAQPDVEIAVIVDPRLEHAECLATRYGAAVSPEFAALLAPDVDAVSICTPTPTHAALAIAAMRAGKHVLCEKPIARTVPEAEAMLTVAGETGVVFTVGHVARFEDDHRKAQEIVARGDLGQLRMASQSITGPFPDWSAHGWFADAAQSGGPVLDLAIHSFDYLLWLFQDRVVRVSAVGVREKIAVDGYALVSLRFENGGIGLVEVSWLHPRGQGLLVRNELVGTEGRLCWDYDGIAALQVVKDDGRHNHTMVPGGWNVQTAGFLRSIREGTAPLVTGHEALDALRVALAALESLEWGRAVSLV
ncbi:MAG TPA: Gfo/Idh/MocA family oxidoreductase [Thermomicrobiales bacterium]|nr:Gfo/Idh/MocA family oxidoreductase [Thermomicrobiales bacterium]